MQPYPFPYIGYFELMARVDRWIVFDTVQYNRTSWMNRNRIQHPSKGWQYFSLPVRKQPHGSSLFSTSLVDRRKSEETLLAQLQHYRRHAPFYRHVTDLVRDAFARAKSDSLVDFNVASLAATADRLAIPFAPELCSRLGLDFGDVEYASQWPLRLAMQLGAHSYLNAPGGQALFHPQEWREAGIKLAFTRMNGLRYSCEPYTFEPHLSILDVLMWNSAEDVRAWLASLPPDGIDYA